jgi:hypothetical protein
MTFTASNTVGQMILDGAAKLVARQCQCSTGHSADLNMELETG